RAFLCTQVLAWREAPRNRDIGREPPRACGESPAFRDRCRPTSRTSGLGPATWHTAALASRLRGEASGCVGSIARKARGTATPAIRLPLSLRARRRLPRPVGGCAAHRTPSQRKPSQRKPSQREPSRADAFPRPTLLAPDPCLRGRLYRTRHLAPDAHRK